MLEVGDHAAIFRLSELKSRDPDFLAGSALVFREVFSLVQPASPLRLHFLGTRTAWLASSRLMLSPRHQEILAALALHPAGLSAEQLALWVWGERGRPEIARAEVRRLRQKLPLQGNPYQLSPGTWADFLELRQRLLQQDLQGALALYSGPLLPGSEAPGVVEVREELWSLLRTALHNPCITRVRLNRFLKWPCRKTISSCGRRHWIA